MDPEKIKRHHEKAKRAILKHLIKEGGSLGLGPLHDYSERRWFIAHRAFSNMMEEYTSEGLIRWEEATGTAHITEEGRAFAG